MLPDEDIKAIADKIVKLNLSVPCVFLLEAHLPLCSMLYNLSLVGAPFLNIFKGYENLSTFFADRKNVENLIEKLS